MINPNTDLHLNQRYFGAALTLLGVIFTLLAKFVNIKALYLTILSLILYLHVWMFSIEGLAKLNEKD